MGSTSVLISELFDLIHNGSHPCVVRFVAPLDRFCRCLVSRLRFNLENSWDVNIDPVLPHSLTSSPVLISTLFPQQLGFEKQQPTCWGSHINDCLVVVAVLAND